MSDPVFVSVAWLRANIDAPGIKVLDGSWHMPASHRVAFSEFEEKSLPGSVFFDIEQVADTDSALPHTCPSPSQFADAVQALGIRNSDFVVVYDAVGLFTAPRVWWLFRLFGHHRVAILEGGLPAWEAAGLPTPLGRPPSPAPELFEVLFNDQLLATHEQVRSAIALGGHSILDARSSGRFAGTEPEPRPGLPSGHMPGAVNLPFSRVVDPLRGTLVNESELRSMLEDHQNAAPGSIITSCGSGVTACVLALALHTVGVTARVYDGSWTEWATRAPEAIEIDSV